METFLTDSSQTRHVLRNKAIKNKFRKICFISTSDIIIYNRGFANNETKKLMRRNESAYTVWHEDNLHVEYLAYYLWCLNNFSQAE